MKKIAACLFTMALCAACSFTLQTKHRGFVFPGDLEAQVASAKTAADLEKKLGSPQARTIFGDTVWIYYGADENYHGPFPVTYDNKRALLVWSDKAGKITRTKILSGDDLPHVWIDGDETPIPAAIELNAIEELVNNVGRFTPAGLGQ
jgi:outer membrane protein assembly factor BamE (lipoprotein component of BamABCDE complex)